MPPTGYPPPDHILRDLGIRVEVPSATTARARLPASPHVAGADGGVRAGVLAVLVDLAAGAAAVRSLGPDWMATADLTVQLGIPARGPWVEARAEVVRRGRTTLVVEVALFDVPAPVADGAEDPANWQHAVVSQVGTGTVTMAVLPARPSDAGVAPDDSFPVRWAFGEGVLARPVAEAVGATVCERATGRLSMPVVPYVQNSFGAAQGGVMALMAELSGLAAVGSAGGGPVEHAVVSDLQVAYLELGRIGPITSRSELLGEPAPGGHRAVVELVDEGAGDRLTTLVNVVVAEAVGSGGGTS